MRLPLRSPNTQQQCQQADVAAIAEARVSDYLGEVDRRTRAWARFPELAGPHLKLHRVGSRGLELTRTADGLALASSKAARVGRPKHMTKSRSTA
jgi:hypothetical protein